MVRKWQRLPSWEAHGECMYPIMSKGSRVNQASPGGVINVFFVEPDVDDWSRNLDERCGFITWHGAEVEHVQVEKSYRRRGIATELFRLAQTTCPGLRHSSDLNNDAQKWIAGMETQRTLRRSSAGEDTS